jgi:hypothetical protein
MEQKIKKENDIVRPEMSIEQWVRWAYRDIAVAYKYNKKYIAVVYRNIEDLYDPREDEDHLWKLILFHREYKLGDYQWMEKNDLFNIDDFDKYYEEHKDEILMKLNVYAYEHGGLPIISLDNSTYPFNDRWDAYMIGYAILLKQDLMKFFDDKELFLNIISGDIHIKQKVKEILKQEIKTYNDWLSGNTYCFDIYDKKTLEHLDGCGGFYGNLYDTIKQMKELVDEDFKELFDDMETF